METFFQQLFSMSLKGLFPLKLYFAHSITLTKFISRLKNYPSTLDLDDENTVIK